jgi:hypothetical protein
MEPIKVRLCPKIVLIGCEVGNTDVNRCGERSAASEAVGPLETGAAAAQAPITHKEHDTE